MKNESKKFIKDCEKKLKELQKRYQDVLFTQREVDTPREDSEVSIVKQASLTSIYIREKMLRTLPEIHLALQKIQEGSYGICENSGEPIKEQRLRAVPWARVNIQEAA